MLGQARTIGGILLAGGMLVTLAAYNWLVAARDAGDLMAGGFALGLFFVVALTLPVMAGGIYLLRKGKSEVEDFRHAERMKQLLGMVLTQGKVRVADVMVELGLPREEVRDLIYESVAKGLFSGYVNWRDGVLYAAEAVQGEQACPVCGGVIEIAGKGAFTCPYCGTELLRGKGEEGFHVIRGIQPPAEWAAGGARDALPGAAEAGAAVASDAITPEESESGTADAEVSRTEPDGEIRQSTTGRQSSASQADEMPPLKASADDH